MQMRKLSAVRDFHEYITNSGHLADTYGFQMSPAIVNDLVIKKYPAPIRRAFFQQCTVEEPTFKQFVDIMNETIRKEELINPIPVPDAHRPGRDKPVVAATAAAKAPSVPKAKVTKKGDRKPEAPTGARKKEGEARPQRYKCTVCAEFHYEAECPQFKKLSPKERFHKARKEKICFSCLKGSGHRAHQCRNKKECGVTNSDKSVCAKFHHPWLHMDVPLET